MKGAHNPLEYVGILGKTFVQHEHGALLEIGPQKLHAVELGAVGVSASDGGDQAQSRVQELGVRSLAQLAKAAPQIGKFKGLRGDRLLDRVGDSRRSGL